MGRKKRKQKVNILDENGLPIYNHLYDDGGNILLFDDYGFVERYLIEKNNWQIKKGWR